MNRITSERFPLIKTILVNWNGIKSCFAPAFYLLFSIAFFTACSGQEKPKDMRMVHEPPGLNSGAGPQIAQYIRNIIQDKNGNLWFGTNGDGVVNYDGKSVSYFSNAEGFSGEQITSMAEDPQKNLWFATNQGVVKYDWSEGENGKMFTNYPSQEYFEGQNFWGIFADSKGVIWAGSATGLYRFDGKSWEPFELPYLHEEKDKFLSKKTTPTIIEDRAGNLWFGTNGNGVFKYNGETFTHYSKADGLAGDYIDQILEDSKGNLWFTTRFNGVCRFDGQNYTYFNIKNGLGSNEVCVIFEDRAGDIWFSSEGYGVYRYNEQGLTNYNEEHGLGVRAVQTIFEDREGRFWVGGGGGLYRKVGETFINVTQTGPWK